VLIILAFFSCVTAVQGAGSRLALSYGRDGALPASAWLSKVHARFRTPVNALLAGSVVSILFVLLTVIAAIVAWSRRWTPEGVFQLGRWGWTVSIVAALYLGLLLNVVVPTGLTSGRGLFNLDWITLLVMVVIAVIGALYFVFARPDRNLQEHLHDALEPTGAERHA